MTINQDPEMEIDPPRLQPANCGSRLIASNGDLQVVHKDKALYRGVLGSYPGRGGYTEVCFTSPGIGQFRPGSNANPHLGQPGQLEEVGEVRCEVFCGSSDIARDAVQALKRSHPYEEVAYEVYKIEDF